MPFSSFTNKGGISGEACLATSASSAPKVGTGLSSHELNQPGTYQDVTDTTVTAMFKITDSSAAPVGAGLEGAFLIAWTTTPWTLPSNTALTVGPKIQYVSVKTYNQYTFEPITIIVAKDLAEKQFDKKFTKVSSEGELEAYSQGDKKIWLYRIPDCNEKSSLNFHW